LGSESVELFILHRVFLQEPILFSPFDTRRRHVSQHAKTHIE